MKVYVEFIVLAVAISTFALVHGLPHSDDNEYTFGECSQHCPSSGDKCSTCCAEQGTRFKAQFSSCRSRRCLCRTRSLYIAETFEGFEEFGGDTSLKKTKPYAPAPSYAPAPTTRPTTRAPITTRAPPIYTRAPTTARAPIYTRAPTTTRAPPTFTRAPATTRAPPTFTRAPTTARPPIYTRAPTTRSPPTYTKAPPPTTTTTKKAPAYSQGLTPSTPRPRVPPSQTRTTSAPPRPKPQKNLYSPNKIENVVSGCERLCPRQEFNCSKCCKAAGYNIWQSGCHGYRCVCNN